MRRIVKRQVKDESNKEVQQLIEAIHALSARIELLAHQNQGLQECILHQKKHLKRGKPLDLQQRKEYHGGSVFWSPRKVREARVRRTVVEREKVEQQLQKSQTDELRRANKLYNEKIAQQKREARETAKAVREKAKAEKAAEKEHQQQARDAAKAIQLSQRGKRKASQATTQKHKHQKRASNAVGGVDDAWAPLSPPHITTMRGRNVKLLSKYR